MTEHEHPAPRSLQEWMERHGVNNRRLLEMVKEETGHVISESMLSFILRGSRRCSKFNAFAFHCVTKVPMADLMAWPKPSEVDKQSGDSQNTAA